MELWDAYDRDGQRTGQTLIRGEAIPDELYHLVCDVLVRHADGDYLLMRRSPLKPNHPDCEEATAGGSALQGEDPLPCARRELAEETGLSGGTFTELGRSCDGRHTHYVSYLYITDAPKDAIRLQEGETVGYRWISAVQFRTFIRSSRAIPSQAQRLMRLLPL